MYIVKINDGKGAVEKRFRLLDTAVNRFERLAAQPIKEVLEEQYYRLEVPPTPAQAVRWGPIISLLPGGGSVVLQEGYQNDS